MKIVFMGRAAIWLSLAAAALVGCRSTAPADRQPAVVYRLVPQFCSTVVPVWFFVDSVQVGVDTFRIDVAGGDHLTSLPFPTSVGAHVVGAKLKFGSPWPDTLVSLQTGQVFTDSLPFYCS